MTDEDIDQTAHLHISYLPTGFFPQLGPAFVRRWHRTFIDAPAGVALVIKDPDGQVAAFLLGTTDQHAYVRDVLHHDRLPLAWRGAAGLLSRPTLTWYFLRTRATLYALRLTKGRGRDKREPGGTSPAGQTGVAQGKTTRAPASEPIGVVHAVVTRPAMRGAGYGRLLLLRYESEVSQAGTRLSQLVTRADGGAADFYRRLGWREMCRGSDRDGREIVQFDRVMGLP